MCVFLYMHMYTYMYVYVDVHGVRACRAAWDMYENQKSC